MSAKDEFLSLLKRAAAAGIGGSAEEMEYALRTIHKIALDIDDVAAVLAWLNQHRPEPTPAGVSCHKCSYRGPTPGPHKGCNYHAHLWPAKPGYKPALSAELRDEARRCPVVSAELREALENAAIRLAADSPKCPKQAALVREFLDSTK